MMNEKEIWLLAQVEAHVALMHSLISKCEGMAALNTYRIARGETIAYDDAAFFEIAEELEAVSNELIKL